MEERIKINKYSNACNWLLPLSIAFADDYKTIESSLEGFLPPCNAFDDADPDAIFQHSDNADPDTMFEHLFHEPDQLTILNINEKKVSSQNHHPKIIISRTNTMQLNTNPLFSPPNAQSNISPWYCPLSTYYNTNRNWVNSSCECVNKASVLWHLICLYIQCMQKY